MARTAKREISIFNFSFLDILATTIGVIIFIMVLALLNASARLSSESLEEECERLTEKIAEAREAAGSWKEKATQEREALSAYAQDSRGAARDVKRQQEQRESLNRQLSGLQGKKAQEEQRAAALGDDIHELTQAIASRDDSDEQVAVEFRLPVERETTKKPVVYECDGGKVYAMIARETLNSGNYTATGLGSMALVVRRSNAQGEPFERAQERSSQFANSFKGMTPSRNFVKFLVRPTGYTVFRKLRQGLWNKGYEINWTAYAADEQFIFNTGGGGTSTVQ